MSSQCKTMTASKVLTSMVELTCHFIITMDHIKNAINPETNTSAGGKANVLKTMWKHRMDKINIDLKFLSSQLQSLHSSEFGVLHCYQTIINYLQDMYDTFYHCFGYGTNSENHIKSNQKLEMNKWIKMINGLEKLHSLCMDPNSNILIFLSQESIIGDSETIMDTQNDENDHTIVPPVPSEQEKKEVQLKMKPFDSDYQRILLKLSVQYCLEYISDYLWGDKKSKINQSNIERFHQCINDGRFEDDEHIQSLMLCFIEGPRPARTTRRTPNRNNDVKLKSRDEILEIINDNDNWFNCVTLLEDMEALIQNWYKVCFPLPEIHPERYLSNSLKQLGAQKAITGENQSADRIMTMAEQESRRRSGNLNESQLNADNDNGKSIGNYRPISMNAVMNLEAKRIQLNETVVDPLPEILTKASTAKTISVQTSTGKDDAIAMEDSFFSPESSVAVAVRRAEKKKELHVDVKDNNEDVDSNDDDASETNRIRLADVVGTPSFYKKDKKSRKQLRFTSSQSQSHQSVDDDDSLMNDTPPAYKKQKRRRFTEEEMDAIKDGYRKFGSNWKRIKSEFINILSERSTVNIKDCFRTMKKRGEI